LVLLLLLLLLLLLVMHNISDYAVVNFWGKEEGRGVRRAKRRQ